ncbi:MAG TPA: tripartite tricarboxylate transporter substrate binding protein [Burkholderiales bacterium]|nr:tripartite tricarboxylate transporter substrate binding protein [Burkholderiales bacterium]
MAVKSLIRTVAALALSAAAFTHNAGAAWPEKTVRVIIPWPPGGSTDVVGRLLAAELTQRLKQQFIIDNRAGAGSIIGLQYASQLPADGYSLMLTSTAYGFLIDKPKVPVDLVNSFAPVAFIGMGDSALTIHPSLQVNSVQALIDLAKKRPGELLYASSGIGGFPHMSTELFKMMTKTQLTHVPFKGGGPAAVDVMAGHTQIIFGSLPTVATIISAGRLKLLATGGAKRNANYPKTPTIAETVPGYESSIWWGVFAPKTTPADVIARVHGEINTGLTSPELLKRLDEQGAVSSKMSSSEFGKLMVSETNKWLDVIRVAGIKAE